MHACMLPALFASRLLFFPAARLCSCPSAPLAPLLAPLSLFRSTSLRCGTLQVNPKMKTERKVTVGGLLKGMGRTNKVKTR